MVFAYRILVEMTKSVRLMEGANQKHASTKINAAIAKLTKILAMERIAAVEAFSE